MYPQPECGPCMLKWVYERVSDSASDEQRFVILKRIMHALVGQFEPSTNLGSICNSTLQSVNEFLTSSSDKYEGLKRKSNEAAEKILEEAASFIRKGSTAREQFVRACGLAAISNVAPIGAPTAPFEFTHVEQVVRGGAPLPSPKSDVYSAAAKARKVLYVADNAGEIGFDSLLIAILKNMGAKVTLVVKEGPFFDDATPQDVCHFGLEKVTDEVLSVKGIFVPQGAGPELALVFEQSDLVISKGTGNFEALKGDPAKKPTLYLLKAKCLPVCEQTGTPFGEFIVSVEENS